MTNPTNNKPPFGEIPNSESSPTDKWKKLKDTLESGSSETESVVEKQPTEQQTQQKSSQSEKDDINEQSDNSLQAKVGQQNDEADVSDQPSSPIGLEQMDKSLSQLVATTENVTKALATKLSQDQAKENQDSDIEDRKMYTDQAVAWLKVLHKSTVRAEQKIAEHRRSQFKRSTSIESEELEQPEEAIQSLKKPTR